MNIWLVSIFLAFVSNAAVNAQIQVCTWTYVFISPGNSPRSGIAGSYGISVFNFFFPEQEWKFIYSFRTGKRKMRLAEIQVGTKVQERKEEREKKAVFNCVRSCQAVSPSSLTFSIPTSTVWEFQFPTSLPTPIFCRFDFSPLSGCAVVSRCGLICNSLMTEVEHLFICSLAFWIYSFVQFPFKSFVHFILLDCPFHIHF